MVELAEISDARDQLEIAREPAQLDVLRAVRRYRQIAARADLEPRLWVYIYLGPRAHGTRETDTACALAIECGRWEGVGSAATLNARYASSVATEAPKMASTVAAKTERETMVLRECSVHSRSSPPRAREGERVLSRARAARTVSASSASRPCKSSSSGTS